MDKKILNNNQLLNSISEYLIAALDELSEENDGNEFVNGEITAFVECLEILMLHNGYGKKEILNIEKKYQIT